MKAPEDLFFVTSSLGHEQSSFPLSSYAEKGKGVLLGLKEH